MPATATQATKDGAIAIGGNSLKAHRPQVKMQLPLVVKVLQVKTIAVAVVWVLNQHMVTRVALGTGSVATAQTLVMLAA